MSESYVYIMASESGTLYVGSTVDVAWRASQHRQKEHPKSFTAKYNCTKLVYYEVCEDLETARLREYQIKQWNRKHKEDFIRSQNPQWKDLFSRIGS